MEAIRINDRFHLRTKDDYLLSPGQVAPEIESGMVAAIGSPVALPGRLIDVTTRADWRPTPLHARFLDLLTTEHRTMGLQESE